MSCFPPLILGQSPEFDHVDPDCLRDSVINVVGADVGDLSGSCGEDEVASAVCERCRWVQVCRGSF